MGVLVCVCGLWGAGVWGCVWGGGGGWGWWGVLVGVRGWAGGLVGGGGGGPVWPGGPMEGEGGACVAEERQSGVEGERVGRGGRRSIKRKKGRARGAPGEFKNNPADPGGSATPYHNLLCLRRPLLRSSPCC